MNDRRPLPVLRAMVDSIDRDILALLARRMSIVGEIAAYKREHQVKIRDLKREREVLDDRAERAEQLGLPAGVIESVFRLILMASRDRQAALKAELPVNIEPKTVAIIGGEGGMGRLMAKLFADLGHTVIVADLATQFSSVEAAKAADVVVISVPIDVTESVIAEVGPHIRADGLLMDVTSVKEGPMRAMLANSRASVVGTHPMFGPKVHSLQGQRVVLISGRGEEWYAWVQSMLRARGLVVTEASATEHDRAMGIVQVLTHFKTQVAGVALSRLGIPIERSLDFTSPAYLMDLYVIGRHFAQSPRLYGSIEMTNPRTPEVTSAFVDAAREVAEILLTRDQLRFEKLFADVRRFFGSFTDVALEQSSFLIDRLVERA